MDFHRIAVQTESYPSLVQIRTNTSSTRDDRNNKSDFQRTVRKIAI